MSFSLNVICVVLFLILSKSIINSLSSASKTYNLDEYGQRIENPIVWNKAHNLPDHVFFSHAQHVHPNTANIDCRQCHGHVETYTLGRVSTIDEVNAFADTDEGKERKIIKLTKPLLTMGWCIECHNEKEVDLTRPGYYEEIHNRLKKKPSLHNMIYEGIDKGLWQFKIEE